MAEHQITELKGDLAFIRATLEAQREGQPLIATNYQLIDAILADCRATLDNADTDTANALGARILRGLPNGN